MSRWIIERSGTGVERAGTGARVAGTGVERNGTGIEKSGTGIEKSGTGIERAVVFGRRAVFACCVMLMVFASQAQAVEVNPAGALQVVVDRNTIAVSWIFDGSVFSGVSYISGSYATLPLTEVAISTAPNSTDVTGGGTGSNVQVTGGGTGNSVQVTGGGTGNSVQVTGGGTGSTAQVTGGGTGSSALVTGGGTGISVNVTGGGTGNSTLVTGGGTGNIRNVTGGGTGNSTLVTGGGTGTHGIGVTAPEATGIAMEVSLGCQTASVTLLDASYSPLATFTSVPVIGDTGLCGGGFGGSFKRTPPTGPTVN